MANNLPDRTISNANITRVVPVVFTDGEFVDENGFFIRAGTGGTLKYCPMGNNDTEFITKEVDASVYFIDPEVCRKIFELPATSPSTAASDLYVGYGV